MDGWNELTLFSLFNLDEERLPSNATVAVLTRFHQCPILLFRSIQLLRLFLVGSSVLLASLPLHYRCKNLIPLLSQLLF